MADRPDDPIGRPVRLMPPSCQALIALKNGPVGDTDEAARRLWCFRMGDLEAMGVATVEADPQGGRVWRITQAGREMLERYQMLAYQEASGYRLDSPLGTGLEGARLVEAQRRAGR